MIGFLRSLHRHQFFTLSSGIVVANLANLAFMPLLTRLYPVESFGLYAIFFSYSSIAGAVATLRLDAAIPISKSEEEAQEIANTVLWSVTLNTIWLTLIFSALLFGGLIKVDRHHWIGLVASTGLATWFVGFLQIQVQMNIRCENFRSISFRYIVERVGVIGFSCLLYAKYAAWGLIFAQVIGHLMSTVAMRWGNPWKVWTVWTLTSRRFLEIFRGYKDFPTHSMPSLLAQLIVSNGGGFIFSTHYGPHALGLYSLAQRLIDAPNGIIQSALTAIYYRRILKADPLDRPRLAKLALSFLVPMALLSIILGYVYGEALMTFLFGSHWAESAKYLAVLLPLFGARLVYYVLSSWLYALRRLDIELKISTAALIVYGIGIAVGLWISDDLLLAVTLSSFGLAGVYSISAIWIYILARRSTVQN